MQFLFPSLLFFSFNAILFFSHLRVCVENYTFDVAASPYIKLGAPSIEFGNINSIRTQSVVLITLYSLPILLSHYTYQHRTQESQQLLQLIVQYIIQFLIFFALQPPFGLRLSYPSSRTYHRLGRWYCSVVSNTYRLNPSSHGVVNVCDKCCPIDGRIVLKGLEGPTTARSRVGHYGCGW